MIALFCSGLTSAFFVGFGAFGFCFAVELLWLLVLEGLGLMIAAWPRLLGVEVSMHQHRETSFYKNPGVIYGPL